MSKRQRKPQPTPDLEARMRVPMYSDGGFAVLTERCLIERGNCCGCDCRHCPYLPRATKGSQDIQPELAKLADQFDIHKRSSKSGQGLPPDTSNDS